MRLRLSHLTFALPLGAITSVLVAWGCGALLNAHYGHSTVAATSFSSDNAIQWDFRVHTRTGAMWMDLQAIGLKRVPTHESLKMPRRPPAVQCWNDGWPQETQVDWYGSSMPRTHAAFGWPCLAMWCEPFTYVEQTVEQLRAGTPLTYATQVHRGFSLGTDGSPANSPPFPRVLPLGFIWSGLLVNTLIYAFAWFLLIWMLGMPRRIRSARRQRLGICTKCGYDLRHSASNQCPECGRAILSASPR